MASSITDRGLIDIDDCLAVIGAAAGRSCQSISRQAFAALDPRSPDEGLALLGAYVSITDHRVRQAILDAVTAIAAEDAGR